jgi:predicted PurR-regulated permease PerM
MHVMRKGPRPLRLQAWGGVVLFVLAGLWLVYNVIAILWPILVAAIVALVGIYLVRRAVKGHGPS